MKSISIEEALESVQVKCSDVENGELRYHLIGKDGSAYVRTEVSSDCFENSHYHKFCSEIYVVQSGTIFFLEVTPFDNLLVTKLRAGDVKLIQPDRVHNVFACKGAVIHTVKFGKCKGDDWHPSEKLDSLTKHLTRDELETLAASDTNRDDDKIMGVVQELLSYKSIETESLPLADIAKLTPEDLEERCRLVQFDSDDNAIIDEKDWREKDGIRFLKQPIKVCRYKWMYYNSDCASLIADVFNTEFVYVFAFSTTEQSTKYLDAAYQKDALWDKGYAYYCGVCS